MAVTHGHYFYRMTANADAYSIKQLVNKISIQAGAVGGVTTLTTDGGKTFFTMTMVADTEATLTFSIPQWFNGIAISALGTNVTVTVFLT